MAVNLLAGLLAAIAVIFYVVGYTLILKRRTTQNIVWGGAAGCMPVLIGWVAVTGSLTWPPVVLFLIVFLWTPPHYWPLSLRYREDYERAGVPMLPVRVDAAAVAGQILRYSWAMVAASWLLVPVAGMSRYYVAASVVLGAVFLWQAYALKYRVRHARDPQPMVLFHYSISYLALLFLAVGVDPFLRIAAS
jgi:protoheme IX farnesyltransferase